MQSCTLSSARRQTPDVEVERPWAMQQQLLLISVIQPQARSTALRVVVAG